MKTELLFEGKYLLSKIKQDLNTKIWYIEFENKIYFQTSSFWRLLKDDKIVFISSDNNQKYHFDQPKIDLSHDILNFINNNKLIRIQRIIISNDLIFTFENNIKIVIYVSSTAFENWEISINNKQYICLNNGEIAIFNNSYKP